MNIAKYANYFHDGYVNSVSHTENNIFFALESSVIEDLNQIDDKSSLSTSNTFKGDLVIKNIKNFKVGDKRYDGIFRMEHDDGDILDLEIHGNSVFLLIEWKNFPPKARQTDVSEIEIEAEEIRWEPEGGK
jgi:hypothetical protein